MDQQISFIHCADLHLDSPFKGLSHISNQITDQVRESTFQAFNQMIELAIDKQVDFVLIVGDIFDQEEQSMKAHMTVIRGFRRLMENGIYVYLSFGNHDFMKSQTFPRNYPDNVFVFEKEQVEVFPFIKNAQVIANIYGFSYYNRAVENNMVPQYKIKGDVPFHIASLHGSLGNSNTDHANYAPFQLNELKKSAFDYWALGHIHKREILSDKPAIVYPGNIQGRSIKETGEKGCYHVTLSESGSVLEFCRLDQIQFRKVSLDAAEITDINEVMNIVEKQMELTLQTIDKVLLELTFVQAPDHFIKWDKEGKLVEMRELWNEQFSQQTNWAQILKIKIEKSRKIHEWQEGEQFLQQLQTTFAQSSDLEDIIEPLWYHVEGRKWLDQLAEEEQEELLSRAKEEVFYLLHESEESE
ncbi:metallophosphoesterase family protein [Gracilibacillus oryzae]|uniref:metallophosphoesterase family protein n=1 Tax=Gracilibacillus oryzae TaxID=1672701 RepID=UPI001886450E|nr:DNA repair exonuclease [Gracilibacillus oryzae]